MIGHYLSSDIIDEATGKIFYEAGFEIDEDFILFINERKINKIDLLKVDAEGFDFQVLKSSETLLQEKKIKLLKIEIWAEDDSVALISNYLNKFGYTLAGMTNLSYLNNRLKFYDAYYFVE